MDYVDFCRNIDALYAVIAASGNPPDAIVGVARGGWLPAVLLSRKFKNKQLYSFGLTYADVARTQIAVYQDVDLLDRVREVLLVEDYLESGKCMAYAAQQLGKNGVRVRTAALGYLEKSVLIPTHSLGPVQAVPPVPWDAA